jgi:hypothetical protein
LVFLYLLGVSFLLLLWVFHLVYSSCSRNSRIRTTPICRRRKPICRTEDPSAEDNTHLQKTHLLFLGFCFPEELGNVGEEFGAPIVIFLLHYGTHWSKSGHLGGGGAADKEANRQARGFDSLSISLLLLLFCTCYHHPLFSRISSSHPFCELPCCCCSRFACISNSFSTQAS